MVLIEELKNCIDLYDLVYKLGLKLQKGSDLKVNCFYYVLYCKDVSFLLFVFNGGRGWKDYMIGEGGSCIDLVMYVESVLTVEDVMCCLYEIYSILLENLKVGELKCERLMVEYIVD